MNFGPPMTRPSHKKLGKTAPQRAFESHLPLVLCILRDDTLPEEGDLIAIDWIDDQDSVGIRRDAVYLVIPWGPQHAPLPLIQSGRNPGEDAKKTPRSACLSAIQQRGWGWGWGWVKVGVGDFKVELFRRLV